MKMPGTSSRTSDRVHASFRDPSGFLFRRDGILYRQINQSYRENYETLIASGLYQKLVKKRALLAHGEVDVPAFEPSFAYKVIQPRELEFISYPYEWSFCQLKDAALLTLSIQKQAFAAGMVLKDGSAYNIQFDLATGKPVLIDTLSFERYSGGPWVAYRQFCQHFLVPLALMAHKDVRLNQLMRVYIDGIPLELGSKLLPGKTRLNFGLAAHIHAHAVAQRQYAGKKVEAQTQARHMNQNSFLGLMDSLEKTVQALSWNPTGTEWGDYTDHTNYSAAAMTHKKRLVESFLKEIAPELVWDLGANTGEFSRLASQRGIPTIAFDMDPGAVEHNYSRVKAQKETHLLPLLLDLTNPSPSLGWSHQERDSLLDRGPAGAVFALALIHHLVIGNNVPLAALADFFAQLSRWLVIEFVPKSDSQVQRLLASRVDIFPEYNPDDFEAIFSTRFKIYRKTALDQSERILYWMERL